MGSLARDKHGDLVIGRDSHGERFTDGELARRAGEYASAHGWMPDGDGAVEVWPESQDRDAKGRDYDRVPVWHFRIISAGEVVPTVAGHLHLERDEDNVIRVVHVQWVDPVTPFFYG